ncbi:SusC/RagA family TonB-linked outer membrane protein [Bacteroidales bacterium]|nr:SusC/RagA family TonB-linked outer membrane protein [Bacteroidales bacterium]
MKHINLRKHIIFKIAHPNLFSSLKTAAIFIILLFPFAFANAQQIKIEGTINDNASEPMIGVSILIKGTHTGTSSDAEGKFSLNVPDENAILQISFIGFIKQEIRVLNQRNISISLKEDAQQLEELVVVGYGTQKKTSVTGAVSSVRGDDLASSPQTNLSNAMLGRMAGVMGFTNSGEPGNDNTTIRIRGTNTLGNSEPLVVIDGVPSRRGGLNRLNAKNIESMSVLKDAAAAIYGSRAANGVILIVTKKGKTGKPTLEYSGNYGQATPIRLPKMANAFQYGTMLNEIKEYGGSDPQYSPSELGKFAGNHTDPLDAWLYPNTDWYKEGLKNSAPQYRHDMSISGGTKDVSYYLNIGANGQDGLYKRSALRYDQYDIQANIEAKISKHITVTYGMTTRMEQRQYPTKGAGDIFSALRRSKPTEPGFWPNGMPGPDIEYGNNPVVMATDDTGYDKDNEYYIQNNLQVAITIPGIDGLKLIGNGAYDKYIRKRKKFQTPWYLYSWDKKTVDTNGLPVLVPGKKGPAEPMLDLWFEDHYDYLLSGMAVYEKKINDHTIGGNVGVEMAANYGDLAWLYRRYFFSTAIDQIDAGGDLDKNNSGKAQQEKRLNYFGRVAYNYKEKYLAEFVWRIDGSYIFPRENRYGFFPGAMLAWRASEEDFWKENISFINYFKLRASYSQTGNDRVDPYQYETIYSISDHVFGDQVVKTLFPSVTPNTNITWEKGTTYNAGFDFKFLGNRLSWETDLFYHKRTHMLISRNFSIPETSGLTLPKENIGEMENKGIDMLLNFQDGMGDWQYSIGLNGGLAANKVLFWDEVPNIPSYQRATGKPIFKNDNIWDGLYYVADGVFRDQAEVDAYMASLPNGFELGTPRPGDIRFKDLNGDGKINADDRERRSKNPEPKFVGGFTVNLSYKDWDVSMLFQGAMGGEVYVQTWSGDVGNFLEDFYDKRWTEENPNNKHPRAYNRDQEYWISKRNDYFLHSTDYIRFKNIEIGYNLPFKLMEKWKMQSIRLYSNVNNLFTIDKLKVADPEMNNGSAEYYPQSRIFNFGVSIAF